MSFFGDEDPFEEILREFFGSSPGKRVREKQFIRGEGEERTTDFVEDEDKIYLIFELPGYTKKDISIIIKKNKLEINAQKIGGEKMQDYLHQKLKYGLKIEKILPKFINTKSMINTMKNGILEIKFDKTSKRK